ncbi:MAG: DNA primase, partial [Myxococcales bacterium]|nr:DNA primase [Myxococcales bacterium]
MARIPEETLQAIRDRVDLVDLIGRHVNLKKSGRNFTGLCPFHQEKTPSFNVNVERQIFHCFGCGEGGNAISFLIKHENLTFPEAARTLARELGIEVPEHDATPGASGLAERLRGANQLAQELYVEALAASQAEGARAYLAQRGIGPEEIASFGIGFAPASGRALLGRLEREKIPAEIGKQAGLLGARDDRHFDMLRGRVTFPIQDARGQVLGFGGRAMSDEQKPKYLNTPESPVYKKREVLYGLHLALAAMRKNERAVVVEGYFDRIAMHRAGVEEAVATCGTSLTAEHARALRRRTQRVVLVFDGDAAGQKAIESSLHVLLPEGLRVEAVLLPAGQDPDDLLASEGAEGLRARVDAAVPAIELVTRRHVANGCSTP